MVYIEQNEIIALKLLEKKNEQIFFQVYKYISTKEMADIVIISIEIFDSVKAISQKLSKEVIDKQFAGSFNEEDNESIVDQNYTLIELSVCSDLNKPRIYWILHGFPGDNALGTVMAFENQQPLLMLGSNQLEILSGIEDTYGDLEKIFRWYSELTNGSSNFFHPCFRVEFQSSEVKFPVYGFERNINQ